MMKGQLATPSPATAAASDLVLSFVNTRPNGVGQPELLDDRQDLGRWLEAHGLHADGPDVTNSDAAAARELREALAVVLRDHVSAAEADEVAEAEAHLHRAAARCPLIATIDTSGSLLVPADSGVPGAFASILAAVHLLAAHGQWARLKMCKNPPCHASFLDKTKNSGGLYCSTACSSQMAMRAYRSRLKTS